MPQVINTNIPSLNSQRNLNTSQTSLSIALQRLSSGLRINSAKDDAAGLAISERFTTQIRGLNQATRNSNDGISLAQTGEGALAEITTNLQRIRELAVQSANATNSASDRAALDLEVQQRIAEIDRTAVQTSFNGQKILDGSFGNATFQVGANVGETIGISLATSMRTSALGQTYGTSQTGTTLTAATGITAAGQYTFAANGVTYDVYQGTSIAGDAQSLANAVNALGVTGLTATAAQTTATGNNTGATVSAAGTGTLTLNGKAISIALAGAPGANNVSAAMDAINANSAATGVSAALDGTGLKLTASDGRNITAAWAAGTATGSTLGDLGLNGVAATTYGSYNLAYSGDATLPALTIGGGAAAGVKGQANGTLTPAQTGTQLALSNVKTVADANDTINTVDAALTAVSNLRSTFGAIQNRFESVISNLAATAENLTASRSRIQDTDFAAETAALTRSQILQQSGIAMLSQANGLPNNVLSLLRG